MVGLRPDFEIENLSETMGSVQERFDDQIREHLYQYYWCSLGLFDWESRVDFRKDEVPRSRAILQTIESVSGVELKDKKMLDIGCGWGGFVVAGLEMGANASGCDIDKGVLEIAALRSKQRCL